MLLETLKGSLLERAGPCYSYTCFLVLQCIPVTSSSPKQQPIFSATWTWVSCLWCAGTAMYDVCHLQYILHAVQTEWAILSGRAMRDKLLEVLFIDLVTHILTYGARFSSLHITWTSHLDAASLLFCYGKCHWDCLHRTQNSTVMLSHLSDSTV